MDLRFVSFVPAPFIGSSGGGIAQVVHRSAVSQVVTLTGGVTVGLNLAKVQLRRKKTHLKLRIIKAH